MITMTATSEQEEVKVNNDEEGSCAPAVQAAEPSGE